MGLATRVLSKGFDVPGSAGVSPAWISKISDVMRAGRPRSQGSHQRLNPFLFSGCIPR